MKLTNVLGLPEAIVSAVANDAYDSGGSDISVTALIAPPQIGVLRRQHDDELVEDVADRLWALMGSAMHAVLERAHDSAIQEQRLFTEVDGWTVSGQFDRLHAEERVLQDYKFSSVWEYVHGVKPERVAQLNLLAELARRNGYAIERLEVVYLFRDWSRLKAKAGDGYPPHQMAVVPVPMWEPEVAEAYLNDRVALHKAARLDGDIRPCSVEERWAKPDVFAVKKVGRKTALKLHDSLDEATQHADNANAKFSTDAFYVEERPGESTRCEHYCAVASVCPQFATMKGEST